MKPENAEGGDVGCNRLLGELREGGCGAGCDALASRAAEEIERLNAWVADYHREMRAGFLLDQAEIERLRDALGRIVTEVSDELPGDTPPTGIQTLAHTVAVIATVALTPNAALSGDDAEGGSVRLKS